MTARFHMPFVVVSLVFLLTGTTLGWLLPSHFTPTHLRMHGQFQVYGFCVLFTMGIAYQMLGELLGARHKPGRIHASLLCTAAGTVGVGFSGHIAWTFLQKLGVAFFLANTALARPPAPHVYPRKGKAHPWFLLSGTMWLLVARTPEQVLWGFLSLYILGVGLRVHPGLLRVRAPAESLQWCILACWNAGLLTHNPWLFGVCSMLILLALRPRPRNLVTASVTASYAWLLIASILNALGDPGAKHALGSGFVLLMIVGMAFRLLPAFAGRKAHPAPGWLCLALLLGGVTVRVFTGNFAVGVALQAAGIYVFAGWLALGTVRAQGAKLPVL